MEPKKELMFKEEKKSFEDAEFKEKLRKHLPAVLDEMIAVGKLFVGKEHDLRIFY